MADADGGHHDDFAQHNPDDVPAPGAERHADADLVRASRHVERDRAVEPDARDQQREHRERRAQPRQRDFGADLLIDVRGLSLEVVDREPGSA